ncbi:MAG: sodium:alanine symporter family protein [Gammaproteobacteria bacterium]|nr:sodium:alanine symporter family protein [Gammaproteobacteria bacterium]MBU1653846.1 sodium:alanine symporter family protein [Gammaproteobacteria bacterium]MBU1961033.1 sodium:alanine symporter family protein [Gammaproteobacteria bacterium]
MDMNALFRGPALLMLLLGIALFLSIGLHFLPVRGMGYGIRMLWRGPESNQEGDISPFNALMLSLFSTIGMGSIVGVATAIAIGGPGAVFWMWCAALIGMALRFAETVLAVHFRERNEEGHYVGGPMYYIKNGLGQGWSWLAWLFALLAILAGIGIGNMVPANAVAGALKSSLGIPYLVSGLALAGLVYLIIMGGVQRLARVAGILTPLMVGFYVAGGLTIIVANIDMLPGAIMLIFKYAFSPAAATGGFTGTTVLLAMRWGMTGGFANETGLGTAAIANAAARTDEPVRQGAIAMLGTLFDTLIVCTITALVILVSGEWSSGKSGVDLVASAFANGLSSFGLVILTLAMILFAFTTILGWGLYFERCGEYLFGNEAATRFRWVWPALVLAGAQIDINLIWLITDTFGALMAIPNLIALLLLSPVVFHLTYDYFERLHG